MSLHSVKNGISDFGEPYGIRKVTRIGHPEVFTFLDTHQDSKRIYKIQSWSHSQHMKALEI